DAGLLEPLRARQSGQPRAHDNHALAHRCSSARQRGGQLPVRVAATSLELLPPRRRTKATKPRATNVMPTMMVAAAPMSGLNVARADDSTNGGNVVCPATLTKSAITTLSRVNVSDRSAP